VSKFFRHFILLMRFNCY